MIPSKNNSNLSNTNRPLPPLPPLQPQQVVRTGATSPVDATLQNVGTNAFLGTGSSSSATGRVPAASNISAKVRIGNESEALNGILTTWKVQTKNPNSTKIVDAIRKTFDQGITGKASKLNLGGMMLTSTDLDALSGIFEIPTIYNTLTELHLGQNNITTLPHSMSNLGKLEKLSVIMNENIEFNPISLSNKPFLKEVFLVGTNFGPHLAHLAQCDSLNMEQLIAIIAGIDPSDRRDRDVKYDAATILLTGAQRAARPQKLAQIQKAWVDEPHISKPDKTRRKKILDTIRSYNNPIETYRDFRQQSLLMDLHLLRNGRLSLDDAERAYLNNHGIFEFQGNRDEGNKKIQESRIEDEHDEPDAEDDVW